MKAFLTIIAVLLFPAVALAQPHWGTFPDGGSLYFYTNTVGTDGAAEGFSTAPTVVVYKNNSATELTSGVSIDDNFDGKTGFHQITIDTTQTDFDAGASYTVMYSVGAVDSISIVGRIIGSFRLGTVPSDVVAWNGTAIPGVDTAGYPKVTIKSGVGTGEIQTDKGAVVRSGLGQAYNNVRHVGSGQAYSMISAATTAASAGDLIIVHPGTYTETLLGKNDVTYYLSYGAILDGSTGGDNELFSSSVTRFRVLGHGTLKIPTESENEEVYSATGSNVDVMIECDTIDGTTDVEPAPLFFCGASTNTLMVRANRIIGSGNTGAIAAATDGRVFIEANSITYEGPLTNTFTGTPVVKISAENINTIQASPIQGSTGTVILNGLVNCLHPAGNGLNAPSGVTVVAEAGAVKVASGVPSLSGAGTLLVADAFAFNSTNTNVSGVIVPTRTAAIKAKTDSLTFTVANEVNANTRYWSGGLIPEQNETGVPEVDITHVLGDPVCD